MPEEKIFPTVDVAYRDFLTTRKRPLTFELFRDMYTALINGKETYTAIARDAANNASSHRELARKIDHFFGIRSPEKRKEIELRAKSFKNSLEHTAGPQIVADARMLMHETDLTFVEIQQELKQRHGRLVDLNTLTKINRRYKERSQTRVDRIAHAATGSPKSKMDRAEFEKLLFAKKFYFDKKGKRKRRFRYSITDIAELLSVHVSSAYTMWKRHYTKKRSAAANLETEQARRSENVSRAKRSPVLAEAMKLLNETLMTEEEIMEALIVFERSTNSGKLRGKNKGSMRNRADYRVIINTAKQVTGLKDPTKRFEGQLAGIPPEEKVHRFLDKGWSNKEISSFTKVPPEEVQRIRRLRIIVFEHLQRAGAFVNSPGAHPLDKIRELSSHDTVAKIFRTPKDWQTAVVLIRKSNTDSEVKARALNSLSSRLQNAGYNVPHMHRPNRNAHTTPPSFDLRKMLAEQGGVERTTTAILRSSASDEVKKGLLQKIGTMAKTIPRRKVLRPV